MQAGPHTRSVRPGTLSKQRSAKSPDVSPVHAAGSPAAQIAGASHDAEAGNGSAAERGRWATARHPPAFDREHSAGFAGRRSRNCVLPFGALVRSPAACEWPRTFYASGRVELARTCGGSRAVGPHGRSVRLGAGESSDARFGPPRSTQHYAGQCCPPHSPERFTSHDIIVLNV